MKLVFLLAAAVAAATWGARLFAQEVPGCGVLQNAYGPFDYRDPVSKRDNLPIVESFHFTPDVESLRHGRSGSVLGDLRYTLRAFPNHHRALKSMARYGLEGFRYVMSEVLGMSYGISKLPYGVLIDENGRVAAMGIVNSREHLDSLFEAKELEVASIQEYMGRSGT